MKNTSVLQYRFLDSATYALGLCDRDHAIENNPVFNWMAYGKLPQNLYVYPSYSFQTERAYGYNKYLASVTVAPIPAINATVELAAGSEATITMKNAYSVTSSDTTYATASISEETVTIDGVAAGTATIIVKDSSGNTMATIVVTVSA